MSHRKFEREPLRQHRHTLRQCAATRTECCFTRRDGSHSATELMGNKTCLVQSYIDGYSLAEQRRTVPQQDSLGSLQLEQSLHTHIWSCNGTDYCTNGELDVI